MRWYKQAYDWIERRVQLEGFVKESVEHPVPHKTASWWYVFGSASFVLLLLQIVTGILLALVYVPSAGSAWASLQALNHELPRDCSCVACTAGDRTSWSPSCSSICARCFSSARISSRASSRGSSVS